MDDIFIITTEFDCCRNTSLHGFYSVQFTAHFYLMHCVFLCTIHFSFQSFKVMGYCFMSYKFMSKHY